MKENNNNKNKIEEKNLEYNILGDAYIGDLFNMTGELDNSSQNLMIYTSSDEIQKSLNKKTKK